MEKTREEKNFRKMQSSYKEKTLKKIIETKLSRGINGKILYICL